MPATCVRPNDLPLICPVCASPLKMAGDGRSFFCPNRHSFDLASEGYLNLLLSGRARSSHPGDDREMVRARRDFLRGGYYRILLDALVKTVSGEQFLADCGCGEGYYTGGMAEVCGKTVGIDISKEAVRLAAKSDGRTFYLVGSSFALPLKSGSVTCASCIFTPVADAEISRILVPGGRIICVIPGKRHLWRMKTALYDHPYENSGEAKEYPGFSLLGVTPVSGSVDLPPGAVRTLFSMTPYCKKTSPEAAEKLFALPGLKTEIEFLICEYVRKNGISVSRRGP